MKTGHLPFAILLLLALTSLAHSTSLTATLTSTTPFCTSAIKFEVCDGECLCSGWECDCPENSCICRSESCECLGRYSDVTSECVRDADFSRIVSVRQGEPQTVECRSDSLPEIDSTAHCGAVTWCKKTQYVGYKNSGVEVAAHAEPRTLWEGGPGTKGATVVLESVTNNDPECTSKSPIKVEVKARGATDYRDYTFACNFVVESMSVNLLGYSFWLAQGATWPYSRYDCPWLPGYYDGPHMLRVSWCSGSVEVPYGAEPKLKLLFVPLGSWDNQESFDSTVQSHTRSLVEAVPLASCPTQMAVVTMKVPNEIFNGAACDNVGGMISHADSLGYRSSEYDAIIGITKTQLCDGKLGQANYDQRTVWVTQERPHDTPHEVGHLLGLEDEYCSNKAGSSSDQCNDGVSEANNLDKDLDCECDPAAGAPCCTSTIICDSSRFSYDAQEKVCKCDDGTILAKEREPYIRTCGSTDRCESGKKFVNYAVCCEGNQAESGGRCIMSYSDAQGPRDFCVNCKAYLAGLPQLQC